jgi:phage terminase large subunit
MMMQPTASPTSNLIQLPHQFDPRVYQLPFLDAMDSGFKRAICVWHRRAGKDKCFCNFVAKKMMERVGIYYYVFPTYNQGRKALWENFDRDGFRMLDHFPKQLRYGIKNDEMMIQFIHPTKREDDGTASPGSIFRVIGSDNVDTIVGTNPIGVVFSEYSLQDPRAWDFLRPILAENGGWAVFNFTPRGKNHGFQLLQTAKKHPERWYTSILTVDDTQAVSPEVLEQEKEELYDATGSDAHFLQEYYVSFDAPVVGAYFGKQMMDADRDKRITRVPWEADVPVDTFWDLGMNDTTAIWFVQTVGRELRIIDYLENSGEGLTFYAKELGKKPYVYGRHFAPHDIEVRELGSGVSRRDTAAKLGINFRVVPRMKMKEDGIDAARKILPRCWFDEVKCERGINALRSYEKEFDEKNKTYKDHPLHNWASNGADAFQQFGIAYQPPADPNDAFPNDGLFDDNGFY